MYYRVTTCCSYALSKQYCIGSNPRFFSLSPLGFFNKRAYYSLENHKPQTIALCKPKIPGLSRLIKPHTRARFIPAVFRCTRQMYYALANIAYLRLFLAFTPLYTRTFIHIHTYVHIIHTQCTHKHLRVYYTYIITSTSYPVAVLPFDLSDIFFSAVFLVLYFNERMNIHLTFG